MMGYTPHDCIAFGFHTIPVSRNKIPLVTGWTTRQPALEEFPRGCRFSHVCGKQLDGSFIIGPEFDHRPDDGCDAQVNFQRFLDSISPALLAKLWITRSTNGRGYHIRARVPREVPSTVVRDDAGRKIGDLRSTGGHLIFQEESKWLYGDPLSLDVLTEIETEELLEALHYRPPARADNAYSLDWQQVGYWEAHRDELIAEGLPHLFSATCQGAQFIKRAVPIGHTSSARYVLIEELISFGYDDPQTAALALHFDFGALTRKGKGRGWLEGDIQRIIGKVRANGPRVRHKGQRLHQGELPIEIDKGGRPPKLRIEQYLYHLQTRAIGDRVLDTQKQIATDLKCSQRTIQRLEKEATATGHLKRVVTKDRQSSFIVLLTGSDTTADTQAPIQDMDERVLGGLGGNGMSAPQNGIRQHVEAAVAELTGKRVRRDKRAAVVLAYVRAYEPDADPVWVEWLRERVEVWNARRREDARLLERLKEYTFVRLTRLAESSDRKAKYLAAEGKRGQARVQRRLHDFYGFEIQRRITEGTAPPDRGGSGGGRSAARQPGHAAAPSARQERLVSDVQGG
jgi:hypothetical protein